MAETEKFFSGAKMAEAQLTRVIHSRLFFAGGEVCHEIFAKALPKNRLVPSVQL